MKNLLTTFFILIVLLIFSGCQHNNQEEKIRENRIKALRYLREDPSAYLAIENERRNLNWGK